MQGGYAISKETINCQNNSRSAPRGVIECHIDGNSRKTSPSSPSSPLSPRPRVLPYIYTFCYSNSPIHHSPLCTCRPYLVNQVDAFADPPRILHNVRSKSCRFRRTFPSATIPLQLHLHDESDFSRTGPKSTPSSDWVKRPSPPSKLSELDTPRPLTEMPL